MNTPCIALSSTRQWNPGDEFILMGVRRVLAEAIGAFHPVLYNRNPMLRGLGNRRARLDGKMKRWIGKGLFPEWMENSLSEKHPPGIANIAIFAGSPEWTGARAAPLYEIAARDALPVLFLGLGSQNPRKPEEFTALEKRVFQEARLITTRDELTRDVIMRMNWPCKPLCPCPALYAAPWERTVTSVRRLALGAVSRKTIGQRVGDHVYDVAHECYARLEAEMKQAGVECVYVAHHVDDLATCVGQSKDIFYSYDASDYLAFYESVDFVVTPRVHGIGLAASFGVPGVGLAHDPRADTMKGFLAPVLSSDAGVDNLLEAIHAEIENASIRSDELIRHKRDRKAELVGWIKAALPEYAV
jgi:hypothetical protein